MTWGTGAQFDNSAVTAGTSGTAVSFGGTFHNFIVTNTTTPCYLSITSTAGTTAGYLMSTGETRTFQSRDGGTDAGFVGVSIATTSGAVATLRVHAWS